MTLRNWLLTITLVLVSSFPVACGTDAPYVVDCGIMPTDLVCEDAPYETHVLPKDANGYICRSPSDFLVSKDYVIQLQTHRAKCDKSVVAPPKVVDCSIYGPLQVLYCSDGVKTWGVSWFDAFKYICVSGSDFLILKQYIRKLLSDIASCS